jgi:hypothetical protein
MRFQLGHDRRNITDKDLLGDLKRVASERKEPILLQRTYRDLGKYGVTTVIRRFGSWSAAVTNAGLEKTVERNVPDEELFEALYHLWVKLGRQPNYSEACKPACRFCASTFERRFGSWRKALEAFVEYANSEDIADISPKSSSVSGGSSRSTSRSINLRLRFHVLLRDRFRCCACGASPAVTSGVRLEVDHIVPWSRGGETTLENLQTLCFTCNQGKSNHHL